MMQSLTCFFQWNPNKDQGASKDGSNLAPIPAQVQVSPFLDIKTSEGEDNLLAVISFVRKHGLDYNRIPYFVNYMEMPMWGIGSKGFSIS